MAHRIHALWCVTAVYTFPARHQTQREISNKQEIECEPNNIINRLLLKDGCRDRVLGSALERALPPLSVLLPQTWLCSYCSNLCS